MDLNSLLCKEGMNYKMYAFLQNWVWLGLKHFFKAQ